MTIAISENPVNHDKAKHIAIKVPLYSRSSRAIESATEILQNSVAFLGYIHKGITTKKNYSKQRPDWLIKTKPS